MIPDTTPIIVGVGQCVDRIESEDYQGASPADLAARAAEQALADTNAANSLTDHIDVIGALRTFEDSTPRPSPFGKPDKFPLAIAKRLGISPKSAILEKAGGHTPLTLLCRLADRVAAGDASAALIAGAEAISSVRHLSKLGETRDWSETLDGDIENAGSGSAEYITRYNVMHGLRNAPIAYGLLENARRARLGLTKQVYREQMAQLFAPFTQIAAQNPISSRNVSPLTPEQLIETSEENRMIAGPYTRRLVSRDQVNQGAALIVTTVKLARDLGIPEDRWIYLPAAALAAERDIVERRYLGEYPAAKAALDAALNAAGKSVEEIDLFDFYSCFPVAVSTTALDSLGLKPDDERGLTVTGGMPFFGGPGNNYSTHAIAEMVMRLRDAKTDSFGLVGLNGGFLSKYGALVLSNAERPWRSLIQTELQAQLDLDPAVPVAIEADGQAKIVTYSVAYKRGQASQVLVIGQLMDGRRFLANEYDGSLVSRFVEEDPIGETIFVKSTPQGNKFAFEKTALDQTYPDLVPKFESSYEHVSVTRRDRILEITIDRQDRRNALHSEAHYELAGIFDAFEADNDLWVAIITGAGDKAFCAGADLKSVNSGGAQSLPKSGFGGITARRNKKPIIAAVNGIAFGGGFEICLACNLVVADETARFALPEVKRGLVAGAGGAMRLHHHLPRNVAMDVLLTGREMTVEEAVSFGFVNRVSKPGDVMDAARQLASDISSVSPTSVRLTLQIVSEADQYSSPDDAAIELLHTKAFDELLFSEDFTEGISAFVQKRPPDWKNR